MDARGAQWPVTIDPTITQTSFTADDGTPSALFGSTIAAATLANGSTVIVVGAPNQTINGNTDQGEAYVFTGSGSTFVQRARLTASDGTANDFFGTGVAVVVNGGTATIVVGTSGKNQVYVFAGSGTAYPRQAILTPPPVSGPAYNGFGQSVAAVTDGTTTTIAIGAPQTALDNGAVLLFAGSGASYSFVTALTDPGTYEDEYFGGSLAFATNGGTNTLVVGAPGRQGTHLQGQVFIYSGAGTTYSTYQYVPAERAADDKFGISVAVTLAHGNNYIAVGAPGTSDGGSAYLLIGSGSSYTATKLHDSLTGPNSGPQTGTSVALGFVGGALTVVAGAPSTSLQVGPNYYNNTGDVFLFAQTGGGFTETALPLSSDALQSGIHYGTGVALTTAVNGDTTVLGGAPGPAGTPSGMIFASYWQTTAAVTGIRASISRSMQALASPAGTYSGAPFHLIADVSGPNGTLPPPVSLMFTVNYSGPKPPGLFNPGDPTSTTIHTTTLSDANRGADGGTSDLLLYPSDAVGTFTVTATVDGLGLQPSATFTLTTLPSVPTPRIYTPKDPQPHPPGLPPEIPVNPASDPYVIINGTGFTLDSQVFFILNSEADPNIPATNVAHPDGTTLVAYLDHTRITAAGALTIKVVNPPGPIGTDGGTSNHGILPVKAPTPPPSASVISAAAATTIYLPPGTPTVLTASLLNGGGAPVPNVTSLLPGVATAGDALVSAGAGNFAPLISQDVWHCCEPRWRQCRQPRWRQLCGRTGYRANRRGTAILILGAETGQRRHAAGHNPSNT